MESIETPETRPCVLVRAGEAAEGRTGIPDGVPHLVLNPSATEPAVAVLARTDPKAHEDVTELPELDALPHLRADG